MEVISEDSLNNPHYDGVPSWSPDGKRIAFMSHREGNTEIYVMDANGGNPRNLTKHGGDDSAPAWYTPPFAVVSRRQEVYNVGTGQTGPTDNCHC